MKLRKRSPAQAVEINVSKNHAAAKGVGRRLGANRDADDDYTATANATPMRNTGISQLPIEVDIDPLLKDIVFSEDLEQKKLVMRLFTDIYYNDAVAGSIVDIKANLMFSEFNLGGILDRKVASHFMENIDNLNIRKLMPHALVDHDVKGAFIGSLLYNETKKTFVEIMPHGYENCKVDILPFFNQDPIITAAIPGDVKAALNSGGARVKAIREYLGEDIVKQLTNDALELDAKSTVYLPRQSFTNSTGTSYYRRILPIYLLEKNLFRGTLIESARRQRGILHVTLDGGGEWEPTSADFDMITQLIQNADADPLGAVIATRSGISTDEFRCLAGDTLVSSDNGIVRLDSIVEHQTDDKPFSVSVDLRVKGHEGKFVDVDQWHYQGNKPVFEITTQSGSKLKCTDNHRFLISTFDGKLQLRRLKDIDDSCYMLIESNRKETVTSNLPIDLVRPNVETRKHNADLALPEYMTPDLAYLIGLIVSEGYIGKNGVFITNGDTDILNRASSIFVTVFNMKPRIRQVSEAGKVVSCDPSYRSTGNVYELSVNSRHLVDVMKQLGLVDSASTKNSPNSPCYSYVVPWSILQADEKSKLAFIAAYVDGDGSVVVDKSNKSNAVEIKFFSRSSSILQMLKAMLAELGFYSVIDNATHRLNVQSSEACRLYNILKPYICAERKKPFEFCDVITRRQFGIPPEVFMPILKSRFLRRGGNVMGGNWFEDDHGSPVHVAGPFGDLFRHYANSGSYFLYEALDNGAYSKELDLIKQVSKTLYKRIMKLARMRFKFEKIVGKEAAGTMPVYDLSIKGNEEGKAPLFLANGIVTHNSGGDFWRVNDAWDSNLGFKLKALGISEAFLSGDSTFSNQDTSMSFFIDGIRCQRDLFVRTMLYNRIFPLISALNGFVVGKDGKLFKRGNMLDKIDPMGNISRLSNGDRLLIPSVHWEKTLKPEGDQTYLDMLQALTDKGVPVPIRALAAAAGFNLERLLADQQADKDLMEQISKYSKEIADIKAKYAPAGEDGGDGAAFASAAAGAKYLNNIAKGARSDVLARNNGNMLGLASRDFGEDFEVAGVSHDGKRHYLMNQKLGQERANRKIIKQLKEIKERNNTHLTRMTKTPFKP